jgi:hypothetical protein
MATPTEAGFYWAKWINADRGTSEASLLTPADEWDVVYVFENSVDRRDRERFRVLVVGVEHIQSIDGFEWGPGPLTPPQ